MYCTMRIVILLFRQLNFVVVNACECEVEPWNEWSVTDATCGPAMERRERVCSSCYSWNLCMTCNDEDNRRKYESRSVVLAPCRKLNLDVKLLKITFFSLFIYEFLFI